MWPSAFCAYLHSVVFAMKGGQLPHSGTSRSDEPSDGEKSSSVEWASWSLEESVIDPDGLPTPRSRVEVRAVTHPSNWEWRFAAKVMRGYWSNN